MTWIAATVIGLLAALNIRLGRSVFYPPALFCSFWTVMLLIVALSGDTFYPLSLKALAVFVLGALAFTVGGSLRLVRHQVQKPEWRVTPTQELAAHRFLMLTALVLVVAFPFYWQHLQDLRAATPFQDFWRAVRYQTCNGVLPDDNFGVFKYFIGWGSFMSFIAVYHSEGSRRAKIRAVVIVTIVFVYHFLTTARVGAMTTLFGMSAVWRMRSGKLNWKWWCAGALILAVVFTVPAILLYKGGDPTKGVEENVAGVLSSLQVYTVGGLAGFSQVMDEAGFMPRWASFRFLYAAARGLGVDVDVPPLILPFTPTPSLTNIYTFYGTYYADFGWAGVGLILSLLGYFITALYQAALRGRPEAVVLLGIAVAQLLFSAAGDGFLISASYWLQASLCALAVYRWPLLARERPVDPLVRAATSLEANRA